MTNFFFFFGGGRVTKHVKGVDLLARTTVTHLSSTMSTTEQNTETLSKT